MEILRIPSILIKNQNAIIANVETILANKVVAEIRKVDVKFSLHYDNLTSFQNHLFGRINDQETFIFNHLINIDSLLEQFQRIVEYANNQIMDKTIAVSINIISRVDNLLKE
jgi:hypothetical protein